MNDSPIDTVNGTLDTGAEDCCFRSASQYGIKRQYTFSLPPESSQSSSTKLQSMVNVNQKYKSVQLHRDYPEQVLGVRIKELRSESIFGYFIVEIVAGGVADR